jgi:hypothetical protein
MSMSNSQTAAPVSRLKKIEWYAGQLASQALAKEKEGRIGDAVVDYLQAADLLLLLSKTQENYTIWKDYTDRATACQQRVKILMAKKRLEDQKTSSSSS